MKKLRVWMHWIFDNKIKSLEYFIALITFGLTVYSTIQNYYQQKSLDELRDTSNAMQYRPDLKLAGIPKIKIKGVTIGDTLKYFRNPSDTFTTLQIETSFRANIEYIIINSGNSRARILSLSASLNSYDFYVERDSIQKPEPSDIKPIKYNYSLELSSGDTINQNFDLDLLKFDSLGFYLHFIIVYENELHNLYDAYFIYRYAFKSDDPFLIKSDSTGAIPFKIYTGDKRTNNIWRNQSSKIYSKAERDIILSNINSR